MCSHYQGVLILGINQCTEELGGATESIEGVLISGINQCTELGGATESVLMIEGVLISECPD